MSIKQIWILILLVTEGALSCKTVEAIRPTGEVGSVRVFMCKDPETGKEIHATRPPDSVIELAKEYGFNLKSKLKDESVLDVSTAARLTRAVMRVFDRDPARLAMEGDLYLLTDSYCQGGMSPKDFEDLKKKLWGLYLNARVPSGHESIGVFEISTSCDDNRYMAIEYSVFEGSEGEGTVKKAVLVDSPMVPDEPVVISGYTLSFFDEPMLSLDYTPRGGSVGDVSISVVDRRSGETIRPYKAHAGGESTLNKRQSIKPIPLPWRR